MNTPPMPALPCTLLEAMARQEGFYSDGLTPDRPQANNNPLDLIYCNESASYGATGSDNRFARFPDVATGWDAARRWLSVPAKFSAGGDLVGGYCGATLQQVIFRFAPPNENQTSQYLANVCAWTGFTPQTVIDQAILSA